MISLDKKKEIVELVKEKYIRRRIDNYEVVVSLLAFTLNYDLQEEDFKKMLYYVFDNDEYLIIKSLRVVIRYIDKEMINNIVVK
jgi:sulfur relay (sulfurtransferase) DsrC/TusE family protein